MQYSAHQLITLHNKLVRLLTLIIPGKSFWSYYTIELKNRLFILYFIEIAPGEARMILLQRDSNSTNWRPLPDTDITMLLPATIKWLEILASTSNYGPMPPKVLGIIKDKAQKAKNDPPALAEAVDILSSLLSGNELNGLAMQGCLENSP